MERKPQAGRVWGSRDSAIRALAEQIAVLWPQRHDDRYARIALRATIKKLRAERR